MGLQPRLELFRRGVLGLILLIVIVLFALGRI
jgi:cell division protein FtsL